ncbi:hypothetical protein FRC07_011553 [Ceratobasidium sp. 392]|nr:hypothetical protein FRC07_011553 [Ceratobasidium sp. 392]
MPSAGKPHKLRGGVATFVFCCGLGLFYVGTRTFVSSEDTINLNLETGLLSGTLSILLGESGLSRKQVEELFLSIPDPESAKTVSRAWTAKPHHAGSEGDYDSAVELLHTFQSHLGINPPKHSMVFEAGSPDSRQATLSIPNITAPTAWIDTYYPLLDAPSERRLEILGDDGSVLWSADLEEKFEPGDPAGEWHDSLGAWHAFSKSGEVRGKLVYAGYGRKWEFDNLIAAGHNLTGAIALVRGGGIFRGIKVKAAQEAGAAACIEYKDRHWHSATIENGYKPWPEGPGFNPDSVERGSVQFLSLYPGDPTTPGTPSYHNANRTKPFSMPTIPSLPISYNNAKVLLKLFDEPAVFSKRQVRLEIIEMVLGAGDPTSGTVSINEVVRGLGVLLKKGWRPLRTIMFASWDAEEYGLIGSTEWGEDFPDFIQKHVVAYMNVDSSAVGERYWLRGSPTVANLLRKAAEELPHPTDEGRTLWDARNDRGRLFPKLNHSNVQTTSQNIADHFGSEVGMLGSGSDYTVFLQRLGIASMDETFRTDHYSPVWHRHSVWDSQQWMETYGDPGFFKHIAIAKHLGLVLLRLASEPILPFNTTQYAMDLEMFLNELTEDECIPDLSDLEAAIKKLQRASMKLDKRKDQVATRLEMQPARRNEVMDVEV